MPKLNQEKSENGQKAPGPKAPPRPKLVNRGPAGLLTKLPGNGQTVAPTPHISSSTEINRIAAPLQGFAVDIGSLTPDPENARVHPERNMESISSSLRIYGQLKPIVVQRWSERRGQGNIIVAGNGTWAAAKNLGWTRIAAVVIDLTDIEAAGFGLADNRTAELAKWDFEVVARIDKLLHEAGQESVGWSLDELEVLRSADWTPPPVDDESYNGVVESEEVEYTCPNCGHNWRG